MSRLKATFRKVVHSRWFPTATKPILAGAIAAGLTYGLHRAGVTAFLPRDINAVASAVAGLVVTAIVQEPQKPQPAPPAPGPVAVPIKVKAAIVPHEPEQAREAEEKGFVS